MLNLVSQPAMTAELARHLVTLHLTEMHEPITSAQWSSICQLRHLTNLRLEAYRETGGGVQEVTGEIASLASLQKLRISVYARDEQEDWCMPVSPALSRLSCLTKVDLRGGGGRGFLHSVSGVSCLRSLKLKRLDEDLEVPGCMAGLSAGLTRLVVHSHGRIIGQVCALTGLSSLQNAEIEYRTVGQAPAYDRPLFQALAQLTALSYLSLSRCDGPYHDDLSPMSKLVNLSYLYLNDMRLKHVQACPTWSQPQDLGLSNNNFEAVPSLPHLPKLQYLNLSMQSRAFQLHEPLQLDLFPVLRWLYVSRRYRDGDWSPQSLLYLADALQQARVSRKGYLSY